MLDFDLESLYSVQIKVLNQAVKRNIVIVSAFIDLRQVAM